MNWLQEWAKIEVIASYIWIGIVALAILIIAIYWLIEVIKLRRRGRK